jgi:hypothetical protein
VSSLNFQNSQSKIRACAGPVTTSHRGSVRCFCICGAKAQGAPGTVSYQYKLLSSREQPYFRRRWLVERLLHYFTYREYICHGRRESKLGRQKNKIQRYKKEEDQMSHHVQAILGRPRRKKSWHGLGLDCLPNGVGLNGLGCLLAVQVRFSPSDAFIRELLFDAIWFVVKFMIPSLRCKVKYNIFQKG